MTTTTTSKIRKDIEKELAALTARCDAIRDVIAALDRLDAARPNGTRPPRTARPAVTRRASAPTQRDQVLALMAENPSRPWTLDDLVANTTIPNKNCARGVITRLRESGRVEPSLNGGFIPTPTSSEGPGHSTAL